MDFSIRSLNLFSSSSWESFRREIREQHRYVVRSPVLDLLRQASAANAGFQMTVKAGQEFMRAQKHGHLDGFAPLKIDRLKAPPRFLATGGRANASGISVLYVAEKLRTAVAEVRPFLGGLVSIARCIAKEDLKVFDLTGKMNVSERDPFEDQFADEFDIAILTSELDKAFAEPIAPFTPERDYAPTQFVAELLSSERYDGIRYRSELNFGGFNYVFFEPSAFDVQFEATVKIIGTELMIEQVPYSGALDAFLKTVPEELG